MEVFASNFIEKLIEGFKTRSTYSDLTNSLLELPTKSPIEEVYR